MPLLSLVVVNFNAAGHLLRCVESLEKQTPPPGILQPEGWLEILVVDNASRPSDRALLATLPPAVRIRQNAENLGYARAINQGLAETRGELVGFLNPDVLVLPGALAALVGALRADPTIGAAGPRTWWDEARTFWLPPLPLAGLRWYLARWLANVLPPFGRRFSRGLARATAGLSAAREPTRLDNLPGSFFLARRQVVETLGGLDPRYLLYFEDTDFCRRLRQAGSGLAYVPEAEIVHFFNQSAQQIATTAGSWLVASERLYLEKHYGWAGWAACAVSRRVSPWLLRRVRPRPLPPPVDLGEARAPVTLDGTAFGRPILFQVSLHWLFLDAAFARPEAAVCSFPAVLWERLEPTRYYARALDAETFRTLRIWTWRKA